MSTLIIERELISESRLPQINFSELRFGDIFSDHMFEAHYYDGQWQDFKLKPYGPVPMPPSANILHYGQGVFEGMKAFNYKNEKAAIFRPKKHYERFTNSCRRMNIPEIPEELFIQGITAVVETDRNWIPKEKYKSMYLRPFVVATDQFLGLKTSDTYSFYVIAGPVGNYYREGINPVKLTTMPEYVRAVRGGVGDAKVPGNYAASLLPAHKAQEMGFTQVMWLDAIEKKYIEEVGSMNMFFVIDDTIITPPLGGSILPGVTRRSVIELAQSWGINVEERRISIDELISSFENGTLTEAFGSGTAAVISPVGLIQHNDTTILLDQENMGPVAQRLYDTITGIHHGIVEDENNWCYLI